MEFLAGGRGEGGGIPLLQAAFGFRAFVAEEEDVFRGDFWGKGGGVSELGREIGKLVAEPARAFAVDELVGHIVMELK